MYWTTNRKIHTTCKILLQNTSLKEFTASNRNRRWKLDPFLQSEAISNIAISIEWRFGCVSVIKTGQNLSCVHLLYAYIENRQNNGMQDAILILRQTVLEGPAWRNVYMIEQMKESHELDICQVVRHQNLDTEGNAPTGAVSMPPTCYITYNLETLWLEVYIADCLYSWEWSGIQDKTNSVWCRFSVRVVRNIGAQLSSRCLQKSNLTFSHLFGIAGINDSFFETIHELKGINHFRWVKKWLFKNMQKIWKKNCKKSPPSRGRTKSPSRHVVSLSAASP